MRALQFASRVALRAVATRNLAATARATDKMSDNYFAAKTGGVYPNTSEYKRFIDKQKHFLQKEADGVLVWKAGGATDNILYLATVAWAGAVFAYVLFAFYNMANPKKKE